jgi:hypothetical protein
VLALALLILAAGTPQQALSNAKATWAKENVQSYSYTVTRLCGRCDAKPARIRVRDGKPSGTPHGYSKLDTMPELFAYIQRAIDSHPHRLTVSFHARTGVPGTLSVDESASLADDVTGFTVTGFRAAGGSR